MTDVAMTASPRGALVWRLGLGLLGLGSVASLLAWVYGLGPFSTWFVAVSLPSSLLLSIGGVVVVRSRPPSALASVGACMAAGVFGGAVGTLGYDLFRVPFTVAGLRVLAPIDSYGVLLLGADASGPATGLAGWTYHFANGLGFGVAYAMVARGRHWAWAVAWAMVLETATILTPFFTAYNLKGQTTAIAIAYAAHVFYGLPLGLICRAAGRWQSAADAPLPAVTAPVAIAAALLVWHQPWSVSRQLDDARALRPQPAAVIHRGTFVPEWLRVRPGECATVRNDDATPVMVRPPSGPIVVPPGETASICGKKVGIARVRAAGKPFGGGFLIVDDQR